MRFHALSCDEHVQTRHFPTKSLFPRDRLKRAFGTPEIQSIPSGRVYSTGHPRVTWLLSAACVKSSTFPSTCKVLMHPWSPVVPSSSWAEFAVIWDKIYVNLQKYIFVSAGFLLAQRLLKWVYALHYRSQGTPSNAAAISATPLFVFTSGDAFFVTA